MDDRLRLMAVHAHPDDESSKGAATMARYAAEGVDVLVVTCTGGELGDILNPAMDRVEIRSDLVAVRRRELVEAINVLGVRQIDLGFLDSGFPEAPEGEEPPPLDPASFARQPLEVAARPLVELIRRERPHVVLTYDEKGGYPHPDHVKTHEISIEAFDAAGDPDRYPGIGEPWSPLKLYYQHSFHKTRFEALHDEMLARGLESPYAERLASWADEDWIRDRITTRVPCAEFFPLRERALIAHATQVDPQGIWFAIPLDVQQSVWPTEDFELARSLVDVTLPEDDLFAGVRELVQT